MVTGRDAWQLLGLLWLCYLSTQAVLVILQSHLYRLSADWMVLLNAGVVCLILLLPTLLLGGSRGWQWRNAFRWRWVPMRIMVITVLGTLGLGLAVSQGMLWLLNWLEQIGFVLPSRLVELLKITTRTAAPPLLVVSVMLPALPEELVFRGVIQQGFEHRYPAFAAIGLTSLFFTLFHLDPIQMVGVFPIALFWGWVTWRSQSILPALGAHAAQNGVTVLSVLSSQKLSGGDIVAGAPFADPNWSAAVVGLCLWGVAVIVLYRCWQRGEGYDRVFADQTGVANGSCGSGCSGLDERSGPESGPTDPPLRHH